MNEKRKRTSDKMRKGGPPSKDKAAAKGKTNKPEQGPTNPGSRGTRPKTPLIAGQERKEATSSGVQHQQKKKRGGKKIKTSRQQQ